MNPINQAMLFDCFCRFEMICFFFTSRNKKKNRKSILKFEKFPLTHQLLIILLKFSIPYYENLISKSIRIMLNILFSATIFLFKKKQTNISNSSQTRKNTPLLNNSINGKFLHPNIFTLNSIAVNHIKRLLTSMSQLDVYKNTLISNTHPAANFTSPKKFASGLATQRDREQRTRRKILQV